MTLALLTTVPQVLRAQMQQANAVERMVTQLDSLSPEWLERFHVPGAVVAVVRRDTVLLLRGWGSPEAGGSAHVTPDTPFRVASVSKLITATAVLQLVEQARLDRQADIARYLEVDFPRRFPGDVTLHHLLTHTAGFDLSDVGDATPYPNAVIPLRTLVSSHPEPQVLPPGFAHHYSNFGFALIAHLIERAEETDFAEYVRRNIFMPLDMRRSSFDQPPPTAIREQLAVGHVWSGSTYRRLPLDYSHVGPADALVTTARDMAMFMRFQLGYGAGVLSQAMRDTMHATQHTATPTPYGMAYAFEENVVGGRRVLQHGGAQLGFASFLVLFPDDDLGVFIVQNAREGSLRWRVLETVSESLLDSNDTLQAMPPGRPNSALDAKRYAGRYRHTGYTHSTFEKAASVLGFRGSNAVVEPGPQPGTLRVDGQTWVHAPSLGAHMFVNPSVGWWIKGFLVGADGRATHHVAGKEVLERVPWWERKRAIQLTFMATLLMSFASLVIWPVVLRRRRARGIASEGHTLPETSEARWARRAVQLSGLLWIVGIGTLFVVMTTVMNREVQFDYGPTWELALMLTLLLLAAVAAAGLPILAVVSWHRGWWSVPARIAVSIQSLVSLAAVAALNYMNLIGYRW